MKQIIQDLRSGETVLTDVPAPQARAGHVLIRTSMSLVSAGTERMLVEFGQANLVQKARQQPDKVKMVVDKIRSDGLLPTLEAVFSKLGTPLPLGYCNVGTVIAVGHGVLDLKVGDRVVSNGPHAEIVSVPVNLTAVVPDNVPDEHAVFTVISSIALQGMRLAKPTFGETVVVVGLGLIGLIACQLLRANGCRVIGVDLDEQRVALAKKWGVVAMNPAGGTDPVAFVLGETGNVGADAVLIAAAAKSNDIVASAARMSRKRGRIVLVGAVGLELARSDFYEKELSFQVSCSYGPGRYDEAYEHHGRDYPIGFVRWTEQRNFEAILGAMSSEQLAVADLITEKVPLADYLDIYGNLDSSSSIGSILVYDQNSDATTVVTANDTAFAAGASAIAIVGAGNFTNATVLPALRGIEASIKYVVSAGGLSAKALAAKAGATYATTSYDDVLADNEVGLVLITTRHNLHARMVTDAVKAGKNVFVEKPLCLNEAELDDILVALNERPAAETPALTVGFNRRFAPLATKMKSLLGAGPKMLFANMNAGFIPDSSWVHDPESGGGRIIGEACHFIDLCVFLTGSPVVAVCMNALGPAPGKTTDNATILLRHQDGSSSCIGYFANGNKAYPKERVEAHCQGKTLVLDNWRRLQGFGVSGFKGVSHKQDKGHAAQFRQLVERNASGGEALIPTTEIVNTTRASFAAIQSLEQGEWITIGDA